MHEQSSDLEMAFSDNHRLLGAGFHELSQWLRTRNLDRARVTARRLDQEAGAHIAFEEQHFYPKLRALLGEERVRRLYGEHSFGLAVVERLCDLPPDGKLPEHAWAKLLESSEAMEDHIAECGALFEALRDIPGEAQQVLYRQLIEWRRRRPTWRQHAKAHGAAEPTDPRSRAL